VEDLALNDYERNISRDNQNENLAFSVRHCEGAKRMRQSAFEKNGIYDSKLNPATQPNFFQSANPADRLYVVNLNEVKKLENGHVIDINIGWKATTPQIKLLRWNQDDNLVLFIRLRKGAERPRQSAFDKSSKGTLDLTPQPRPKP
jgi:hypothetical protein